MKIEITTLEWDAEKYQENLNSGSPFTDDLDGIGRDNSGNNNSVVS